MGLDDERAHLIDSVPSYQEAVTSSYNPTQNNPRKNTLIFLYIRDPDFSVKNIFLDKKNPQVNYRVYFYNFIFFCIENVILIVIFFCLFTLLSVNRKKNKSYNTGHGILY